MSRLIKLIRSGIRGRRCLRPSPVEVKWSRYLNISRMKSKILEGMLVNLLVDRSRNTRWIGWNKYRMRINRLMKRLYKTNKKHQINNTMKIPITKLTKPLLNSILISQQYLQLMIHIYENKFNQIIWYKKVNKMPRSTMTYTWSTNRNCGGPNKIKRGKVDIIMIISHIRTKIDMKINNYRLIYWIIDFNKVSCLVHMTIEQNKTITWIMRFTNHPIYKTKQLRLATCINSPIIKLAKIKSASRSTPYSNHKIRWV